MSERIRRQTMLITTVVLAIVSMILMGVMKHTLKQIPVIDKLLKLQNIGFDSMKDFLEVSELNLRVKDISNSRLSIREDSTIIEWNTDGSKSYTIFISSEYIPKTKLMHSDLMPALNLKNAKEIESLRMNSNWTRKIIVKGKFIARSPQNSGGRVESQPEKVASCTIPLGKFNCRIRSDYGRISRHLSHPAGRKNKLKKNEIDAWVIQKGNDQHLCILEPNDSNSSTGSNILEYGVTLYMKDGLGKKMVIPQFKGFTDFNMGPLPPCLCYVTGIRSVGVRFEQFVQWIHQDDVLYNDEELQKYL